MQLTVSALDFSCMQRNTAFVAASSGEEVETIDELISLNYKVFIAAVVKVVPEETTNSMAFQLVSFRNNGMCSSGEEDISFGLTGRYMRQVFDLLSGQSLAHLVSRDEERLLIAANVIVKVTMQPEHVEADIGIDTGNGAEVQQISFGAVAFGIITELVQQGALEEKEPLRLPVFRIVGADRNEGIIIGQSDKEGVLEDIHGVILLSDDRFFSE